MKRNEYRATITVNVFIIAENQEEAELKFQDMDISFHDPDDESELQSDLIDWEIEYSGTIDEE
jgi:hypothetical protein